MACVEPPLNLGRIFISGSVAVCPSWIILARLLALACMLLPGALALAQSTVTIPWNDTRQEIDGFGTGQCGHTSYLYNWPEPQRSQILDLAFSETHGIGLSILRTAIKPWTADPKESLEPTPGVWNDNDAEQVWLMHEATRRGVSKIFAAVWSPPAWMKTNNSIIDGALAPAHYQDYADFLAHYLDEFARANKVKFYAVSIQNEPDTLGTGWATCGWSSRQFATFLADYLRPTFKAKRMKAKVIAPEASNWDAVGGFLTDTYANPAANARLDIVAGHLYGGDPARLYQDALDRGKKIWQTEGSMRFPVMTIEGALDWAKTIHDQLTSAQVSAWIWWALALWPSDEELILIDGPKGHYTVSKAFWALGNFSRFIRPGYVRLNATANPAADLYTSAYKDPASGRFVIVAVNKGKAGQPVQFNAQGFRGGAVTPYVTDGARNLERQAPVALAAVQTIPAQSVVTYVGDAVPGWKRRITRGLGFGHRREPEAASSPHFGSATPLTKDHR